MAEQLESKADESDTADGIGIIRARETLGDLVNRAGFGNERIPITRHGKQVAAIVGMKDLERLRKLDAAASSADAA